MTGSGKTLAFVLPVIEYLTTKNPDFPKDEIGAIIVSPTRELALQTTSVLELFLKDHPAGLRYAAFIGGMRSFADDVKRYKQARPNILVGTPGRLEELLAGTVNGRFKKGANGASLPVSSATGAISAKHLEVLILDEADRYVNCTLNDPILMSKMLTILGLLL